MRLEDARALLAAGRFDGAYYLAGYAIECASKACVAKAIAQYDFPDLKLAQKSWTHVLDDLVGAAGLRVAFDAATAVNSDLKNNWATVAQWNERFRSYEGITQQEAQDMIVAIDDAAHGVLTWVQLHW